MHCIPRERKSQEVDKHFRRNSMSIVIGGEGE
jgi:hypothetical protein